MAIQWRTCSVPDCGGEFVGDIELCNTCLEARMQYLKAEYEMLDTEKRMRVVTKNKADQKRDRKLKFHHWDWVDDDGCLICNCDIGVIDPTPGSIPITRARPQPFPTMNQVTLVVSHDCV